MFTIHIPSFAPKAETQRILRQYLGYTCRFYHTYNKEVFRSGSLGAINEKEQLKWRLMTGPVIAYASEFELCATRDEFLQ